MLRIACLTFEKDRATRISLLQAASALYNEDTIHHDSRSSQSPPKTVISQVFVIFMSVLTVRQDAATDLYCTEFSQQQIIAISSFSFCAKCFLFVSGHRLSLSLMKSWVRRKHVQQFPQTCTYCHTVSAVLPLPPQRRSCDLWTPVMPVMCRVLEDYYS